MCQKNKPVCWICLHCWPTVWQITTLPQVLNTLSAGVRMAWIQRYFLANWQTCGEVTSCSFHRRGWFSLSAGGVCKELFSSALIASVTQSWICYHFLSFLQEVPRIFFFPPLIVFGYSSIRRRPRGIIKTLMWHVRVPLSQALFICHYIVQFCHINLSFSLTLSPGLSTLLLLIRWSTNIRCDSLRPRV